MFATDRDLLVFEPNLFRDVSFLAQTLVAATGDLESGTLTLATPALAGRGIGTGHVAIVDGTPLEVLSAGGDHTLTLSLLRPDMLGPQIVPLDRENASVFIGSFGPQLAMVHSHLLAMLGVTGNGQAPPGRRPVMESQILNPRDLTRVEALGTLHLVYAAASATQPDDSPPAQRARMYQARFVQERWRVRARIDTNGDGQAEGVRTLNTLRLERA